MEDEGYMKDGKCCANHRIKWNSDFSHMMKCCEYMVGMDNECMESKTQIYVANLVAFLSANSVQFVANLLQILL